MNLVLAMAAVVFSAPSTAKQSCLECHQKETPGVVKPWKQSLHFRNKVGCVDCHGSDYDSNHRTSGKRKLVDATACGECHERATTEHQASKHGIGMRAGGACTRTLEQTAEIKAGCAACHEPDSAATKTLAGCSMFLAQSPAMRRQGCVGCHRVENRCDMCHGLHDTKLSIARAPGTCGTCHMGPDHPQYEMWKTSRHGALFALEGAKKSPDCAGCHMPSGTHNVSRGITMGVGGQAYPEDVKKRERKKMIDLCAKCHTPAFASQNLNDADAVQRESAALVAEARTIIEALGKADLLRPSPASRPRHPTAGRALELGPHMLYEDLSQVEALYFEMKAFYYITSYKGVFHQNPDYAHWYGNAPLKLTLSKIKSEAALLRDLNRLEQRINVLDMGVPATESLKSDLQKLRNRHLKGELDEAEFKRIKGETLDRYGL